MTLERRLTGVEELMESPGVDPRELRGALRQLERLNRCLGGARAVLRRLPGLTRGLLPPVQILDVATGAADIPRAIARWARRRGLEVRIEALDRHPGVVEAAARASAAYPEIAVRQADALRLPYPDGSFDLAISSLLLHHLEGDAPRLLLREMDRVSRRAVLVSDLRRGRLPYLVTLGFLSLASRNRLIRNDGPLSVRRAFTAEELQALARRAGLEGARTERDAFFRMVLVHRKD